MSGDVQPRKRKDKKKKKDDLGVEEPRGTAAVFGDGDVFMHSHHEHGTGGHWCAKIIFFSLLAVLVGLIGLIILENRGLTDLEANSIESPYSNVLEGWLEDAPDDDHHDEHTLELKHHDDDDDDDHGSHIEHDDDDDQSVEDHEQEDEDESVEEVEQSVEDDDQEEDDGDDDDEDDENDNDDENEADDDDNDTKDEDDNDDDENNAEDDEDQESEEATKNDDDNVKESEEAKDNDDEDEDQNEDTDNEDDNDERSEENQDDDDDDDDDDLRKVDENDDENDDDQDSNEDDDEKNEDDSQENDEDDEEHEQEEPEEVSDVEVEHIEREVTDDDVLSTEQTDDDKADDSQEVSKEASPVDVDEDDDVEFLEPDELDELPEVLPIPVPAGKPLTEFEETSSTEKPQDSLAEEEEYERQQEEIRKEKEQASQGLWLKLTVGGALLAATHAVLRRAAAAPQAEESRSREETPLTDRRMTLIAEETTPPASVLPKIVQEVAPVIEKEVLSKSVPVAAKPPPIPTPEPEEEIEEEEIEEEVAEEEEIVPTAVPEQAAKKDVVDMELYSDEEELEEDKVNIVLKEVTPEPEEDDDVEIIDEEVIEEELGEDEEEEEISDVDDADLLNRLEAKYGRLPEPDRFGRKDGGNSIEAEWPGEPNDPYWHDQLDRAERELREGAWDAAVTRASSPALRGSARAKFVVARGLDSQAEAKRDNNILGKAIAAYLELLKMNEHLSDKKLLEVTNRTLDRMEFKGNYLGAEPVYRLLIRRFPKEPLIRNKLTISFLKANRADKAEAVITETLKLFPDDKVALAHYGFILKVTHNKLEEAVAAFTKALEEDTGPACEPRFYYHLGDALMLLGRNEEAHKIHERGATLGHFLSASQRSLYNVERLKSRPWWNIDDTPYREMAKKLEKSWKEILKEGQAAEKLFEQEKEGLREKGEWSQLDLFVRGREVPGRCARAPVTCSIAKFASCSRGQVKFSSMLAGTHVRAHVGPTNCRLRMHLGLSNTDNTYIRVDKEIRQWEVGKVLMFDDSFEHEVWHNGTGTRLVLIVDVWHPDLTPQEKRRLPPI